MTVAGVADQVGRVLGGRYRLERLMGVGASAYVYAAVDVRSGERWAVKILHPALGAEPAFVKRFLHEARAAAAFEHANLLRVSDWGADGDQPYMVTELMEGGTLRGLLDGGYLLDPSQALFVGVQAARGLAFAHGRGLVHRDIKPANLLFDSRGGLVIADFGIARALAEAAWTEPAGTVLGTARYCSPEQAGLGLLEGRSDVYSLALVLYETLTGTVPFSSDTTLATLHARIGATLPPDERLGPLAEVLTQAAAPDVADRPDAGRLAKRFEGLAREMDKPGPLALARQAPPQAHGAATEAMTQIGGARSRAGAIDGIEPTVAIPVGGVHVREPGRTLPLASDQPEQVGAAPEGGEGELPLAEPVARVQRRRRWPLVVALVAIAALAGVLAWGAERYVVNGAEVPSVVGDPLATAEAVLGGQHLHYHIVASEYSNRVPSGDVVRQSPDQGTRTRQNTTIELWVSSGPFPVAIPSGLVGTPYASAKSALEALGFVVTEEKQYSETTASGLVLGSIPAAGTKQQPGGTVTLTVSQGHAPRTVPKVGGETEAAAETDITNAGLLYQVGFAYSDSVPSGEVISTDPAGGATAPWHTTVTVTVSQGKHMVRVPDVTGYSVPSATQILQDAGFQVSVEGPPDGTVFATYPAPGTKVDYGSSVTLATY